MHRFSCLGFSELSHVLLKISDLTFSAGWLLALPNKHAFPYSCASALRNAGAVVANQAECSFPAVRALRVPARSQLAGGACV